MMEEHLNVKFEIRTYRHVHVSICEYIHTYPPM